MLDLTDFQFEPDLARAATMPARWYIAPEFLALEKEKIFARTWQAVGRIDEVARLGDFFTCEVLGEPLVVTRGTDGVLRAFYNVCRHRAGNVAAGKGNRKSLQCRYHGWTYALDGRLMTTPEFEGVEDFDKSCYGLHPVRVETWGPFVFVNLDPDAAPLAATLGVILDETAHIPLAEMRPVERRDYIIDCNWKVYIDNYLEGYHLPIAHPGLYRELDYENYKVETHRYHSRQLGPTAPGGGQQRGPPLRRGPARRRGALLLGLPQLHGQHLSRQHVLQHHPADGPRQDADHLRVVLPRSRAAARPGRACSRRSPSAMRYSRRTSSSARTCSAAWPRGSTDQGRFSVKRENGVHHFHSLVHEFLHSLTP